MRFGIPKKPVFAVMAVLCLGLVPAAAQSKPPESISKVKKVLLYNKIGGWVAVDGGAAVKAAISKLAVAKGFDLVHLDSDADITLDYLKQFQVIVWNNNTDGGKSVPSTSARQAILDYVDQGGGWLLIHGAGDHANTWPKLAEAMGTSFYLTGTNGRAEVVLDAAAKVHKELKWMIAGLPDVFRLEDRWLSFRNTVRPLPGVTVVATSRAVSESPGVIVPVGDGSQDNVYLWARQIGKGRLFYNAMGFGNYNLMEQQDSIVPRFYWENLRYAAGDYQNGCTTSVNRGFDPAARVHSDELCMVVGLKPSPTGAELDVSKGPLRMRLASPEEIFKVRLRDLRGVLVWERTFPAGTGAVALDGDIRPGVYHLEIRDGAGSFQRRLALP